MFSAGWKSSATGAAPSIGKAASHDGACGASHDGPKRKPPNQERLMDEIEVSDEMTKAGIDARVAWERSDDSYPENLVKAIYRAMERVRLSQIVPLVERVTLCPGITVDAGTIFVETRARDPRDTITWKPKSD